MKKYTLKEAFDEGLLRNRDRVDITELYKPLRYAWMFRQIKSLNDFFGDIDFKRGKETRLIYEISFKDGNYTVIVSSPQIDTSFYAEKVAEKLFTLEEFGISARAECNEEKERYAIVITFPGNILVDFSSPDETAYFELPEHTAYVLP